jgi:multidrug efflux pump subunit AcrB
VAFGPPAIPGLGTGAGFTMQIQDRVGREPAYLSDQTARFIRAARERPEIGRISTLYRASVPQIYADIDRSKVLKVGVPLADVNNTLGAPARQHLRERFQQVWACLQGMCRPSPSIGVTRSSSGCSSSAARTARWCRSTRS